MTKIFNLHLVILPFIFAKKHNLFRVVKRDDLICYSFISYCFNNNTNDLRKIPKSLQDEIFHKQQKKVQFC